MGSFLLRTGQGVHFEFGVRAHSPPISYCSTKIRCSVSYTPLSASSISFLILIKACYTHMYTWKQILHRPPCTVPDGVQVSVAVSARREDVTAHSCCLSQTRCAGFTDSQPKWSQGWSPDKRCTCRRTRSHQSLFRGKATSVKISFLIRLQMAFPEATRNLKTHQKLKGNPHPAAFSPERFACCETGGFGLGTRVSCRCGGLQAPARSFF